MGLLVGGQSGQLMNSGVLSGGRQNPPAKRFARYPCRLGSIGNTLDVAVRVICPHIKEEL